MKSIRIYTVMFALFPCFVGEQTDFICFLEIGWFPEKVTTHMTQRLDHFHIEIVVGWNFLERHFRQKIVFLICRKLQPGRLGLTVQHLTLLLFDCNGCVFHVVEKLRSNFFWRRWFFLSTSLNVARWLVPVVVIGSSGAGSSVVGASVGYHAGAPALKSE